MEPFDRRDLFIGARAKATVAAFAEVARFSLVDNGISSAQLTITPLGHSPRVGTTNTYRGNGCKGSSISRSGLRAAAPSENKSRLSGWED